MAFDYTAAVGRLCSDICFRLPELRHIDMSRVAIGFSQTRHSEPVGVFASTVPLRFAGGSSEQTRRGHRWRIQRLVRSDGVDYLYLISIAVPRFIDLRLTEKLETIVHELYHIAPDFSGDLRRFRGRFFAHGASQKRYDAAVRRLLEKWLGTDPPADVWDFLLDDFSTLEAKYGGVVGNKIPLPKMIPVL
ncbi:MAG: hypothetical protein ACRC46_06665 [Thermoguttaceae bacterium]